MKKLVLTILVFLSSVFVGSAAKINFVYLTRHGSDAYYVSRQVFQVQGECKVIRLLVKKPLWQSRHGPARFKIFSIRICCSSNTHQTLGQWFLNPRLKVIYRDHRRGPLKRIRSGSPLADVKRRVCRPGFGPATPPRYRPTQTSRHRPTGSSGKRVVRYVETVRLTRANLTYRALIDTGATTSRLWTPGGWQRFSRGGRRWVRFQITDDRGRSVTLQRPVIREKVLFPMAGGRETCPVVNMVLCLDRFCRTTPVAMSSGIKIANRRLIVGRSFLGGSFLVAISEGRPSTAGKLIAGWKEVVKIVGGPRVVANLDSGAPVNVQFVTGLSYFRRAGRRWVRFSFLAAGGRRVTMQSPLNERLSSRFNRPLIPMRICLAGYCRSTIVYLKRRSGRFRSLLDYTALVGRHFMRNGILVDAGAKFRLSRRTVR